MAELLFAVAQRWLGQVPNSLLHGRNCIAESPESCRTCGKPAASRRSAALRRDRVLTTLRLAWVTIPP